MCSFSGGTKLVPECRLYEKILAPSKVELTTTRVNRKYIFVVSQAQKKYSVLENEAGIIVRKRWSA